MSEGSDAGDKPAASRPREIDDVLILFTFTGLFGLLTGACALPVVMFTGPHLLVPALLYFNTSVCLTITNEYLSKRQLWAWRSAVCSSALVVVGCFAMVIQNLTHSEYIPIPIFGSIGLAFVQALRLLRRPVVREWFGRPERGPVK